MKRWRVRFYHWQICEIQGVEAPTEAAAEERGVEMFEEGQDVTEVDGGTDAADAEEEEE